ncbi:forespore capture DNA-binding protein RefZ [Bacillus tianshenii]|nr:forespore capture DNA-binding protein RefZ [Bacillus tianshenii]
MSTKQKVIDAAISLFNTKGFQGTSVREVAKKADVNPALISYYFGSKKGLLESLLLQFYEPYLQMLEEAVNEMPKLTPAVCLKEMCARILAFQQQHVALTRFVYREMTLDSVLIREMMATYLKRETFFMKSVFQAGVQNQPFNHYSIDYAVIQFKGMVMMPYLYPQYLTEVLYIQPRETYFVRRYQERINRWIDSMQIFQTETQTKKRA